MKVTTETRTTVSSVALTKKEIETLVSAQKICNKIWSELNDNEDIDYLGDVAMKIYNNIDEIGSCLDNIANLVDIED